MFFVMVSRWNAARELRIFYIIWYAIFLELILCNDENVSGEKIQVLLRNYKIKFN